jgi:hypothetical protein
MVAREHTRRHHNLGVDDDPRHSFRSGILAGLHGGRDHSLRSDHHYLHLVDHILVVPLKVKYNMEYILTAVIAFAIGWKVNELIMAKTFADILKDLGVSSEQVQQLAETKGVEVDRDSNVVELRIDTVDDQLLAYEIKNNRFITQATTGEALLSQIIEHYPAGTKINIDRSQGGDIIQKAAASLKTE